MYQNDQNFGHIKKGILIFLLQRVALDDLEEEGTVGAAGVNKQEVCGGEAGDALGMCWDLQDRK